MLSCLANSSKSSFLLAETARLSPEGNVGGITGGVLAFTSIAMMVYPAIYGTLLALTDSYGLGFTLLSFH